MLEKRKSHQDPTDRTLKRSSQLEKIKMWLTRRRLEKLYKKLSSLKRLEKDLTPAKKAKNLELYNMIEAEYKKELAKLKAGNQIYNEIEDELAIRKLNNANPNWRQESRKGNDNTGMRL